MEIIKAILEKCGKILFPLTKIFQQANSSYLLKAPEADLMDSFEKAIALSSLEIKKVMPHHFRIVIPSTINIDIPSNTLAYAELGNQLLTKVSGGATAKLFSGSYKTDGNEYVSEPVIELESWMKASEFLANLSEIMGFLELLLRELNQECLFFVIDSRARLISIKP
ncbi:MAG: hypothetical protein MGF17_08175 [Trichodesmium sp. MAG_R04]|jgi:hypothetical protein|nr:hypothetical protein [Trichodesmium sp. MAG_R04]